MDTNAYERPLILAPVGGAEQLKAALRTGADAVYLGAKGFNARRNAENFAETSLDEAVAQCHERGVKVFVTLNTLVTDDEFAALTAELDDIAKAQADAVIVQDMGVMSLIRARYPNCRSMLPRRPPCIMPKARCCSISLALSRWCLRGSFPRGRYAQFRPPHPYR